LYQGLEAVSNCPVSDSIGRRITLGLWPGFAAGANFNDTSQIDASKLKVDPVVPKDAIALQIVEMAKLTSEEDKKVYKAHPVMKAMVLDDDRTYWFNLGTLQSRPELLEPVEQCNVDIKNKTNLIRL
jgi:hypothetical protein